MIEQAALKHISRLLLIFSDLCNTDAEIAACLTFMQIHTLTGELHWDAESVRAAMPIAYSTVTSCSSFAASADEYYQSIYKAVKEKRNERH